MDKVSINRLKPHPKNDFYFSALEGEKYDEIKRSIEIYGIRDPLKVSTDYTVISGHQRLRIAKELGLTSVPIEIIDPVEVEDVKSGRVTPEQYLEYLLIAENVERRGQAETDPMKKARIAQFLKEYWGVKRGNPQLGNNSPIGSRKDIASFIGESVENTKKLMKLNDLIEPLQQLVSQGKLGVTAAQHWASLTPQEQWEVYNTIGEEIAQKTVKEAEKYRREIENARRAKDEAEERARKAEIKIRELENQIQEMSNQLKNAQSRQEEEKLKAEIKRLQEELEKAKNTPPKVVEVPPADYELIKREKQKYKSENEVLKAEVAMYRNMEKDRVKWATEKMERLKNEAYTFEAEVNAFLEKVAVYGYLADQICTADEAVKQHYEAALDKIDQFIADVRFRMRGNKGIVIDYKEV